MKDVTFVLMTCGEETEAECVAAVAPFRGQIEWAEVRHVYPQITALNRMIDLVRTEYFVPLDSDIILEPDAWARIRNGLNRHRHNPDWHSILWPLWDTLTEKKILALKLLRTRIARGHPFVESPTPDVEHYQRLTQAGYTCVHDYLKQRPIGRHVVRGAHFCYHKFRDVYQTYRSHKFEWDSGVFLGGDDLKGRAKAHYDYFVYKHAETGDPDYLYCLAGMVDGLTSPVEGRSKSLERRAFRVGVGEAIPAFVGWYTDPVRTLDNQAALLF